MKSFLAVGVLFVFSGIPNLSAQATQTTTQFDLWYWRPVKPPAAPQGIAVDPGNDNIWYLASDSGMYVTRDGGATWAQGVAGPVTKEGIGIDPLDPTHVYAGVGSSIYMSGDRWADVEQDCRFFKSGSIGVRKPDG